MFDLCLKGKQAAIEKDVELEDAVLMGAPTSWWNQDLIRSQKPEFFILILTYLACSVTVNWCPHLPVATDVLFGKSYLGSLPVASASISLWTIVVYRFLFSVTGILSTLCFCFIGGNWLWFYLIKQRKTEGKKTR